MSSNRLEIDVVDLLETLEMDNVSEIGRGEVQFSCPFTDGHMFGDSHPSNHMHKEKLVFRCKGCGASGTVFEFVARTTGWKGIEVLRWLRERYGQSFKEPEGGALSVERDARLAEWSQRARTVPQLPTEEWNMPGGFWVNWATDDPGDPERYMIVERKFSIETLVDWKIGYDVMSQRVTIPARDEGGMLVGFKGRAWRPDQEPKYKVLGGHGYNFDLYYPSNYLFGLDRAGMAGTRRLVITEGELDTIALHALGICDAVALGTSSFTEQQIRLIRWYADEVILFFDTDPAGWKVTWGYDDEKGEHHPGLVEALSPYLNVRIVADHEGDPASMGHDQVIEIVDSAQRWMAIATS